MKPTKGWVTVITLPPIACLWLLLGVIPVILWLVSLGHFNHLGPVQTLMDWHDKLYMDD